MTDNEATRTTFVRTRTRPQAEAENFGLEDLTSLSETPTMFKSQFVAWVKLIKCNKLLVARAKSA